MRVQSLHMRVQGHVQPGRPPSEQVTVTPLCHTASFGLARCVMAWLESSTRTVWRGKPTSKSQAARGACENTRPLGIVERRWGEDGDDVARRRGVDAKEPAPGGRCPELASPELPIRVQGDPTELVPSSTHPRWSIDLRGSKNALHVTEVREHASEGRWAWRGSASGGVN